MRGYLKILIFLVFSFFANSSDLDVKDFFEKLKLEAIEFNRTVKDKEIEDFFIRSLKYQPNELKEFLNSSIDQKKIIIENIRTSHEQQFVKIPILRGLSELELEQLDQVFEYKTHAMKEADFAVNIIEGLSESKLQIVLTQCVDISKNNSNKLNKVFGDDIPKEFNFLYPKALYLNSNSSRIFLHKGIGKGIGLSCKKNTDGIWKLYYFNEYQSWDLKEL